MKRYAPFTAVFLMLIISGFQCDREPVTALSIVEGQVFSCSNSNIEKVIVVSSGFRMPLAVDTLFTDSQGFFTHQFTASGQTFYLVPATQDCSSVLSTIPVGQRSELQLKQTPLFQALKITFNLDPALIDSIRIRILGVNDILDKDDVVVYRDPQNFDSGFTSDWDTLPTSFILGEERIYSLITEIFSGTGSPSIKSESIVIHKELVEKTISF